MMAMAHHAMPVPGMDPAAAPGVGVPHPASAATASTMHHPRGAPGSAASAAAAAAWYGMDPAGRYPAAADPSSLAAAAHLSGMAAADSHGQVPGAAGADPGGACGVGGAAASSPVSSASSSSAAFFASQEASRYYQMHQAYENAASQGKLKREVPLLTCLKREANLVRADKIIYLLLLLLLPALDPIYFSLPSLASSPCSSMLRFKFRPNIHHGRARAELKKEKEGEAEQWLLLFFFFSCSFV